MSNDFLADWAARNSEFLLDEAEEARVEYPTHPGIILREEVLAPRRVTAVALANAIRAARPDVSNILAGKKAITPLMARRIQEAIGYPANLLLRLQNAYDLAKIEHEEAERLEAIPHLAHA